MVDSEPKIETNFKMEISEADPETLADISDCVICGEDAYLISLHSKHVVRVRRRSKCKRRVNGNCCTTEIKPSAAEAVQDWNDAQRSANTYHDALRPYLSTD